MNGLDKRRHKMSIFTWLHMKKRKRKEKHKFTSEVIKFNKLGGVPKDHPFTHREFPGAFKEVEDV